MRGLKIRHFAVGLVGAAGALTLTLHQSPADDAIGVSVGAPKAEAVRRFFRRVARGVSRAVGGAARAAGRVASNVRRTAGRVASDVGRRIRSTFNTVRRTATGAARRFGRALAQGWNTVKRGATTAVNAARKGVGAALTAVRRGGRFLLDKAKELGEKLTKLLAKVGELTKKIAEFTKGEIAQVIAAFKSGPKGVLKYVANKLPGPVGKVVDILFFKGGSLVDKLKEIGKLLLGDLQNLVDNVRTSLKNGVDKVLKPLVAKAKDFILRTAVTPAVRGLAGIFRSELEQIAARVAANILGRREVMRRYVDGVAAAMEAAARGDVGAVNARLAEYNTTIDTIGRDAVNMALDYGLAWVRGKAVAFVLRNVQKLMPKVWTWVYRGVALARNSVQGLVGSIPFVGGALAGALGVLIDQGWELLKSKVEELVARQVERLADLATSKAKGLFSGDATRAGGALQGVVDAIRGPLRTIAERVKKLLDPVLTKYRAAAQRLQRIAAKGGGAGSGGEPAGAAGGGGETGEGEPAAEGSR